jgi:ComF family protein
MKYQGLFTLTKPLAQLMVEGWPVWEKPPDILMPVPLHPRRKKQRGFNQSALLVKHLGKQLGINTNLVDLERVRNTVPQVGLSPKRRQENVRGAFKVGTDSANGKQILLIDDVFTTGATMLAAADALYSAGATSVSAYCLARTI